MSNVLANFFSAEAGQQRRAWLNSVDDRIGNALSYYLGPDLAPRVNALAQGAAMMSPGMDVQDAYTASGELMAPNRSALDRAASGAALAASIGAMAMPGGVSSLRQGIDDVVDAGVRAVRSPSLGSNAGNWLDDIQAKYPEVEMSVTGNPQRGYTVNKIVVPSDARGQGVGTRVMREILQSADNEGATVSLTPSQDFGGAVSRLREWYKSLGFVPNKGRNRDFEISEDMYRLPQDAIDAETPAQNIARLLREGRASEVTDDMLGALTPNDSMELARLYEAGATGADMPMDTASRMARAEGMGFDTDAYHATRATGSFPAFRPGARGSVYMASTPDAALQGAAGQALENPYAPPGAQSVTAIMPLNVRSNDIDGLGVSPEAWRALPEVVDGDQALRDLQPQIESVGAQYWDDVYLSQPRGDGFRYYRNDPPSLRYGDLEPGRDVFGYRLPGWNSGSDVPSLENRAEKGKSGFLVADEAGSSIVADPSMPIRSRFARFDPRLSHLANLNAGIAGAGAVGLGALAMQPGQAEAQERPPLPPELSFLQDLYE